MSCQLQVVWNLANCSLSEFALGVQGPLIWLWLLPSGRGPLWCHHLLQQVHRAGRQQYALQPGQRHQVHAQPEHRPPGHQAREPVGECETGAACAVALISVVPASLIDRYADNLTRSQQKALLVNFNLISRPSASASQLIPSANSDLEEKQL